MKKRYLPLLLLLLLLYACAPGEEAIPQGSDKPIEGHQVHTDWTKLTERQPAQAVYTRYYDSYAGQLIPLEGGYGGDLLYYAGAQLMFEWPALTGMLYGLVTQEGVLVTDPVYSAVTPIELSNGDQFLQLQSGISGTDEYSAKSTWVIAARDGSWCTETLPGYIYQGPDYVLVVGYEGHPYTLVYGDGTTVEYTEADLQLPEAATPTWLEYGNFAIACLEEAIFTRNTFADHEGWHILDLTSGATSQVELAPGIAPLDNNYETVLYYGGLIPAQQGELYGYLDDQGQWAIEPQFAYVSAYIDGYADVRRTNNQSAIIDASGQIYLETEHTIQQIFFDQQPSLFAVINYNGEHAIIEAVYDHQFNRLPFSSQKGTWTNDGWFYDSEAYTLTKGEKVISLPESTKGEYTYVDTRDDYIYINGENKFFLLSFGGEIIYSNLNNGNVWIYEDPYNGQAYLYSSGVEYSILTIEGTPLVTSINDGSIARDMQILNGLIYTQDGQSTQLREIGGDLVFCYPIANYDID